MDNFRKQIPIFLTYLGISIIATILLGFKIVGTPYFITMTVVTIIATSYILAKSRTLDITERRLSPTRSFLWIIATTLGIIVIQLVISEILVQFFNVSLSANTQDLITYMKFAPYYVIYPLVCAPIMEEIIFRKLMFTDLNQYIGFGMSAALSSLLFAFLHQDSFFLVYFFIGLFLCFIYSRTKNIYINMMAHILMNLIVILINFA
ncbi:CPBP family intramembrane glutamic endopeptidase [Lactobacillus terrae]|uniref:CPBP family intramembrane glutamic endopeptidase n=1 Tax=Lactobacillus terrae TaxID=2269374 RepID=UPI000C1B6692|nr:type II CAAX endopeptidase family protein [Lactobacillus terrae]